MELALVTFSDLLTDLLAEQDLIKCRLLLFIEHVDQVALRALDWVGLFIRLVQGIRNLTERFADLRHFEKLFTTIGAERMLAREFGEVHALLEAVGASGALIFLLEVSKLAHQQLELLNRT